MPVLVRTVAACAAGSSWQRTWLAVLASRAHQHGWARVWGAGTQKYQARLRHAALVLRSQQLHAARSYTAQVLAKSCKLIPVMIARFVMDGKRYSVLEYTAAALIAGTSHLTRSPLGSVGANAKLSHCLSPTQAASRCSRPPRTPGQWQQSSPHPMAWLATRSSF